MSASGDNPLSHVIPHPLKEISVPGVGHITLLSDQIVMMIVAGILLCFVLPALMRKRRDDSEIGRMVPGKFASFIEMICVYFRDEVAKQHLGKHADRFIKYIWSAFFFVLTLNLLGLSPFGTVTPVMFNGIHIGGTATSNIWVTATMAILTMILMVVNGLRFGGKEYLKHFMPGPGYLAPLMLVVEVMGLFAKIFALAVRLFANMLAGHVLLAVMIAMILRAGAALGPGLGFGIAVPIVAGSVALNMLELFVAFLQAFIFTYLTTLFIGMSVNVHHDEHSEAAAH